MMNKWMSGLILGSAILSVPAAANEPYQELKNQLEIFTGILTTAVGQQSDEQTKLEDFRYTYVRDQGVIYRARLGASKWRFVAPDIPEPPLPPEAPEMGEFARDMQLDVVVEQGLRSAHRILSKLSGEYSQEWFDLVEQQRDLAWDIRDGERELRDLEFQLRNADDSDKAELTKRRNNLALEIEQLREQQAAIKAEAAALKQQLKQQQQEARQQRIETRDKTIATAEQLLSKTLCDYGVTLKSLPEDEFVTFIIEGADNSVGERRRDRVYVFSKETIDACTDDNGARQLLEQAKPYYF
ncbi:MAG: hypothetical protein COB75_03950 [Idiomarina sp.]|uniref:hypothetical protein n=1 Tax=Idiomarina sp. TaxID=1874361 RepID=UPI000C1105A2|nr:hypothetical protein [Idiomarina sp.]MBL4742055.1 hypothetical protein [Idiomarina sp.]PHQ77324.1 MAG: hypothetical protein COB75_03950 [Idiomarina sp.]